jgi:transposase
MTFGIVFYMEHVWERIKNRCYQNNCSYKLVDEHYSTKICSHCGYIKNDVGSARTFKCNKCKRVIGRDINGARNIMMLGILDH